jgi:sec-independent protein translocase protein TatC
MSAAAATEQTQTALEHLHELWRRSLYCVGVLIVGGAFGYIFRQQIINFLQRPLGQQLYYTSPMGSFNFVMQVCLLIGFLLALPVMSYNLLRFIEPALRKRLKPRVIFIVLISSFVLALGGAAFGYYLTLPFALQFFGHVGTSSLRPLISVNEYFSFILGYLGTFAAVFQLPLLLLFINHITPFKPGGLSKWRKHVYIGAFAISLIMPSSPDPVSQVSLAIPIIILYELSIVLIWLANRKRYRAPSAQKLAVRGDVAASAKRATAEPLLNPAQVAELLQEVLEVPALVSRAVHATESRLSKPEVAAAMAADSPRLPARRNYQQLAGMRAIQNSTGAARQSRRFISDMLT